MLFRADTSIAAVAQQEFPQHFPADGEVEHEPDDLWRTTVECCRGDMQKARTRGRGNALGGTTATTPLRKSTASAPATDAPPAAPSRARPRCSGTAPPDARISVALAPAF